MRVINDNGEPFMPTLKLVANGTIGGIWGRQAGTKFNDIKFSSNSNEEIKNLLSLLWR